MPEKGRIDFEEARDRREYKWNAMEATPELRGKRGILIGKLLF